ncbi:hypothetical protein HMPREF3159_09745 [Brachybacterium sp. HMSC06H03]|uniref:DUF4282 domain-containing protein n=1 Tax=Brachybacterium sp. HMSC06H03 TaxID=1581127 RepID=UPI0008A57688|nr:DUF4282 domain-containing protein [Brachybacterium sp. HMSC06H03]OFT55952.1 hypothetical protein HMPREF3159_09745 [Brachybacterium sp. HMSC06H03]
MSQPPEGSNPLDPQHGQGSASDPSSSGYGAQEQAPSAGGAGQDPYAAPSSDPYGQQSAAASGQQDAWGAQSAPSAPQPPAQGQAWGSAQSPAAAPYPATGGGASGDGRFGEAGFFKALFDFKFEHFITVKFSSFLYVIAFVVAAVMWLMSIVNGIFLGLAWGSMNSFYGEGGFNAFPLIVSILFGWIPSVIALIAMRLGLEFAVATVRTAQNTGRIAEASQR